MSDIIKFLHGIPIRERNKIYLEFHYRDYEKIVEGSHALGMSAAAYIRLLISPCQKCGHDKLVIELSAIHFTAAKQGPTIFKKKRKSP